MAGATQWKAACPHIDDRPKDVCIHSEISAANVSNWESIRLPADVSLSDLRAVLKYVDDDETVAVCNSCRRINVIEAGGVRVLHTGDPHYNDRVGDWLIDLSERNDASFGNGGGR